MYGGAGAQETLASFVFDTFNIYNILITRKVAARPLSMAHAILTQE
jgi:hypothetical protein